MIVYADSSLLVSLYLLDRHSESALLAVRQSPILLVTPFHETELANAFYRCVFLSSLTEFEASRAWKRFTGDIQDGAFRNVDFPERAWRTAVSLAQRFSPQLGTRSLDSLHVAAALELGAERFWTFDERQRRLAEAAGLKTGA